VNNWWNVKEEANKKAFEKTLQTIKTEPAIAEKPTERYTCTKFDQFSGTALILSNDR
jgi:hypothetical protein